MMDESLNRQSVPDTKVSDHKPCTKTKGSPVTIGLYLKFGISIFPEHKILRNEEHL